MPDTYVKLSGRELNILEGILDTLIRIAQALEEHNKGMRFICERWKSQ